MNKFKSGLGIFLLLVFFAFVSRAIIDVKLKELKVELSKSQLMNYEFSSQALRKKFRIMLSKEISFDQEILNNTLDSYVLNSKLEEKDESLTYIELVGLGVVNSIRQLSLKPFLDLKENQKLIIKLQYAFYLEKNQKFKEASDVYNELLNDPLLSSGNDISFVLLHGGYCDAVLGYQKESLRKLNLVIDDYSGTHFAESAEILISILNELSLMEKAIERKKLSDDEKIDELFATGLYSKVVELSLTKKELTMKQNYQLAYSQEKTGEIEKSIKLYQEIVNNGNDLILAKKANRRLMLIGFAYEGGVEIAKYAEKNALNLNDKDAITQVLQGSSLKKKSTLLENINKVAQRTDETSPNIKINNDEYLKKIQDQLSDSEHSLIEKKEILSNYEIKDIKPTESPYLVIQLIDGRQYKGRFIFRKNEEIVLNSDKLSINLPNQIIERIDLLPKASLNDFINIILESEIILNVQSLERVAYNNKNYLVILKKNSKEIKFNEIISISIHNNSFKD